jgi:hypothetical protein
MSAAALEAVRDVISPCRLAVSVIDVPHPMSSSRTDVLTWHWLPLDLIDREPIGIVHDLIETDPSAAAFAVKSHLRVS